MSTIKKEKVVVVGAGLCGTLLGISLAQRGYEVSLYEYRSDMRTVEVEGGRSINLALSHRGLKALDKVGMREEVKNLCLPMHGRVIHLTSGDERFSKYSGRDDEYINSVSRGGLNIALLDKADSYDNLTIYFNHKCIAVDLETATATFKTTEGNLVEDSGEVLIGTDGAGSIVRRSMMGRSSDLLFNYSQDFLRSGYKELCMPPDENGKHRISAEGLHIWPRGAYMMIALPNLDGSFTVTMFHPYEGDAGFNDLDTPKKVRHFFEANYPDAVPHLVNLEEDYFDNPVGTLGTVKCYPWQAFGRTLVMGDASHAIVPFYGQGMNAAFEDVDVFNTLMDKYKGDWSQILAAFSELRPKDTNAIADLAIDNFYEMQDKVADPVFMKKRRLEMLLEDQFPDYYSKYSLVTFKPELSYHEAMIKGRSQDEYLLSLCKEMDPDEVNLEELVEELKKM